jgi:hypothetical protein
MSKLKQINKLWSQFKLDQRFGEALPDEVNDQIHLYATTCDGYDITTEVQLIQEDNIFKLVFMKIDYSGIKNESLILGTFDLVIKE